MVVNMQKEIIDIVANFDGWRGNSYTLSTLVAVFVKDKCVELLREDYPEAARKLEIDL
jgi:hypothetical protein